MSRYHFFFSSRRRHTRWPRDWSSDVCSSDLIVSLQGFLPRNSRSALLCLVERLSAKKPCKLTIRQYSNSCVRSSRTRSAAQKPARGWPGHGQSGYGTAGAGSLELGPELAMAPKRTTLIRNVPPLLPSRHHPEGSEKTERGWREECAPCTRTGTARNDNDSKNDHNRNRGPLAHRGRLEPRPKYSKANKQGQIGRASCRDREE